MSRFRCLLLVAPLILWGVAAGPAAADDLPAPPAEVADDDPLAAVVAEFRDPPFDKFLDLSALARGLADSDPAAVLDAGLLLADGERALLRSPRGVTADQILAAALRLAVAKNDIPTLERFDKLAARDAGWKDRVAVARKLAGGSRSAAPAMTVSADDPYAQQQLNLVRAFTKQIEAAEAAGDPGPIKEALDVLDITGLDKAQIAHLRGLATAALGRLPEDAAGAELIGKLAAASRGTNRGWVGTKQSGTHTFGKDKYIYVAFKYKGEWKASDFGPTFFAVAKDAIKGNYTAPVDAKTATTYDDAPICLGYYNVTHGWYAYILTNGVLKDSKGKCCYSQTKNSLDKITEASGETSYTFDPAKGTKYKYKVIYSDDDKKGLWFKFVKAF